ncbi:MAG TPA: PxKF domain-containing protein [Gaiellaceae bacterium]|nr:PxKF domain-containing protein [Gaiellaceae bacterium]
MATPTQIARRGRLGLVLGTMLATLLLAAVAYADDIANTLDLSVDAVAETLPLNVGGGAGTTTLYVTPRNGDGKSGCNLTGSATLVLAVSTSDAAVATVSPTSVTFGSCGDTRALTVAPHDAGSATISVSQVSNSSGGTFNLAPATFTVTVAPPPNTAPTIAVGGVAAGASYATGTVPAATCDVVDAEDGASSFAATLGAVTGPYASDGIGSQTASCSYTDAGGLTAAASATYSIVDPSAPTIDATLSPATPDGLVGWYVGDVTLTWAVDEPESPGSLAKTGCVDTSVTTDQAATDSTCAATSAGGPAGPVTVTIKRDGTAPTIAGAVAPAAPDGAAGWYTTAPTVSFTCADVLSGVASCVADGTAPAADSVTLGESASAQSVGGTATDAAGNTATASLGGLLVDLSDPSVASWSGSIGDGDSFYFGSVPPAPTCSAADDVSGPAGCAVTGYSAAVGTHTLLATARDVAGRTAISSRTYTVLPWTLRGFFQPVDNSPAAPASVIWNSVKGGATVPLKFEVLVGATEQTDTAVVRSLTYRATACSSAPADDLELTASGGTSLRYDAVAGHYVYNWQTPKVPGACYVATMTTQDGSTLAAFFRLK